MTTLPQLAATLETVLTEEADRADHQTGFVQTLVFGLGANPHASRSALTQTTAALGGTRAPPALHQRFDRATPCPSGETPDSMPDLSCGEQRPASRYGETDTVEDWAKAVTALIYPDFARFKYPVPGKRWVDSPVTSKRKAYVKRSFANP